MAWKKPSASVVVLLAIGMPITGVVPLRPSCTQELAVQFAFDAQSAGACVKSVKASMKPGVAPSAVWKLAY